MTRSSFLRLSPSLALLSVLSACGPEDFTVVQFGEDASTGSGSGSGDDASPGTSIDGGPAAPHCTSTNADIKEYETSASGTISGPGVEAALCDVAVSVFAGDSTPPGQIIVEMDSFSYNAAFAEPTDATHGFTIAMFTIPTPTTGVYRSGGQFCGNVGFSYNLPIPEGIDCKGEVGPSCPTGCAAACALSCEPCTPVQPSVGWNAQGPSDCEAGENQSAAGSWTLNLTSLTKYPSEENDFPYYIAHGSLSATLQSETGSDATLSLSF